ncbi:MAG: DUF2848 family protein [Acidimicrobiales bacterium]
MRFLIDGKPRDIDLEMVIVAGYTARDRAAVMHHIDELAAIGIPPPPTVPMYWKFPPWLAMNTDRMVVVGTETSGEAELLLIADGDELFVSVASDHTDRAAEAIDIAMSKGICPKMCAREAWPVASIDGRWSELELRSYIGTDEGEVLYQKGPCSSLVSPPELLANLPFARPTRFAMLTGTVPVEGGVRPASHFRGELHDPATGRSITLSYHIDALSDSVMQASRSEV